MAAGSSTERRTYVVDGATAGLVLVVAASDAGPAVFAVGAGASGLHCEQLVHARPEPASKLDSRSSGPGRRGRPAAAAEAINQASDVSRALLAAEQGRWRSALPGHDGGVREDPNPVRPTDRELPGGQAAGGGDAHPGRISPLGRLRRRGRRHRRFSLASPASRRSPARTPTTGSAPRRSSSTEGSDSPGNTMPTSTSSGPGAKRPAAGHPWRARRRPRPNSWTPKRAEPARPNPIVRRARSVHIHASTLYAMAMDVAISHPPRGGCRAGSSGLRPARRSSSPTGVLQSRVC